MALRYFDELLQTATKAELDAMDQMVASRPEFAVYTNLARRVRFAPSALAEESQSPDDGFKRQGLAWVIALARLEMGGMLATFGSHPAPFEIVGPGRFEMEAYKTLLNDGAQTHYGALAADPQVPKVAKQTPGTTLLAYLRRVTLARHFLYASVRSQANQLNPQQVAESLSQKRDLDNMFIEFAGVVQAYVAMLNSQHQTSKTKSELYKIVDACYVQLAKEPKALAMGRATITEE